ncbi:MAG: hypothetical protein INR69_14895 [Mucilaginibacter polytrichastri]|nr:hypothetical protein [Mucilaginibacter polytrichastri]
MMFDMHFCGMSEDNLADLIDNFILNVLADATLGKNISVSLNEINIQIKNLNALVQKLAAEGEDLAVKDVAFLCYRLYQVRDIIFSPDTHL